MVERKRGRKPAAPGGVVRRPAGERKRLPPEVEALARGEIDRLPHPAPRPRLADPRLRPLVPGVANRDARAVYDARVADLRALVERARAAPDDAAAQAGLDAGLAQAWALGLWRGRSVTGFDAFAEQVLDLDPHEARARVGGRADQSLPERPSDEAVAVWMRVEATLLEAGLDARVVARRDADGVERIGLEAAALDFPALVDAMFRRQAPLAREVARQRRPPPDRPPRGPR